MLVRNMSWVLNELVQPVENRKGVGHFTLWVSVQGMKPFSVVNIEVSQKDDFSLRVTRNDRLHLESEIVKKST